MISINTYEHHHAWHTIESDQTHEETKKKKKKNMHKNQQNQEMKIKDLKYCNYQKSPVTQYAYLIQGDKNQG